MSTRRKPGKQPAPPTATSTAPAAVTLALSSVERSQEAFRRYNRASAAQAEARKVDPLPPKRADYYAPKVRPGEFDPRSYPPPGYAWIYLRGDKQRGTVDGWVCHPPIVPEHVQRHDTRAAALEAGWRYFDNQRARKEQAVTA